MGGGQQQQWKKTCFIPFTYVTVQRNERLVEFDKIEKEFQFSRECMGIIKKRGIFDAGELAYSKDEQTVNIREFLNQSTDREVLLFTDGSALGNPGPTGAGAVAYVDGYNCSERCQPIK